MMNTKLFFCLFDKKIAKICSEDIQSLSSCCRNWIYCCCILITVEDLYIIMNYKTKK